MANKRKNFMMTAAAAALAASLVAPQAASANTVPFTDIQDSYAAEAILALYEAGIVNGVGADKFNPGGNLTREQFAKMLVLMADVTEPKDYADISFVDNTDKNAWYHNYIEEAKHLGFMQGYGWDTFGVGGQLTREQAIVALVNAMGLESAALAKEEASTFADADQISSWAKGHVAIAQELGIVKGVGGNNFNPQGITTREMAAMMLTQDNVEEPQEPAPATPAVTMTFTMDGFVAGTEKEFTIATTAANVSQDINVRYKATIVDENGAPLANQVIQYLVAEGIWADFTTDANGVTYFGPAEGFKTEEIGLQNGLTTTFKSTVATAGSYTMSLELVNVADDATVGTKSEHTFTVAGPAQEEQTPGTEETPVVEEDTTGTEEETPVVEEDTTGTEEQTPVVEESTTGTEEQTPVVEEGASV